MSVEGRGGFLKRLHFGRRVTIGVGVWTLHHSLNVRHLCHLHVSSSRAVPGGLIARTMGTRTVGWGGSNPVDECQ
jgi:hypothetical protein